MTETTDVRTDSSATDVTADQRRTGESTDSAGGGGTNGAKTRRRPGLTGMVLADLQRIAGELGVAGTTRMRKSDLIAVIKERQNGGAPTNGTAAPHAPTAQPPTAQPRTVQPSTTQLPATQLPTSRVSTTPAVPAQATNAASGAGSTATDGGPAAERPRATRARRTAQRAAGAPAATAAEPVATERAVAGTTETTPDADEAAGQTRRRDRDSDRTERQGADRERDDRTSGNRARSADRPHDQNGKQGDRNNRDRNSGDRTIAGDRNNSDRNNSDRNNSDRNNSDRNNSDRNNSDRNNSDRNNSSDRNAADRDDFGDGSGRRRGRRFRDRRRGRERFNETEPVVAEDDVLVPVAGILDVLDSYAFIRTTGYLTGPNDVYVSLSQVRKNSLRRGDAIEGAVREPRDGERKDKYNALVRLDKVNGLDPEEAKKRAEFHKLTPLYPQERLRLETDSHLLTTRVIDLVMPIGKGQRALIVSPPKAGKTMVMQAIANAITTNNPECHLMVVLVDERPEEVTDMERSVRGEVIASTFDRPPSDHTTVAELSIERAKRLVELGHDVVVLLDSITRLGRAYNNASPGSGRILSGGIDSTALYPPKRFLGAARNIENGGSLTIIATALVQTGSTGDTVIYEEYKGTGNAELYLDRKLADKRIFPAVDVDASGTRKEEILLSPDELAVVIKLRRVLAALDSQQALELVLDRLRKTRTNVEFLMQVQKTTSIGAD